MGGGRNGPPEDRTERGGRWEGGRGSAETEGTEGTEGTEAQRGCRGAAWRWRGERRLERAAAPTQAELPGRPPPCSWPGPAGAATPPRRCSAATPAPPPVGARSPQLQRRLWGEPGEHSRGARGEARRGLPLPGGPLESLRALRPDRPTPQEPHGTQTPGFSRGSGKHRLLAGGPVG